jgi:hypothetical protein
MCLAARFRARASNGVLYQFRFRSLAAAVAQIYNRIYARFLFVVLSVLDRLAIISPA